MGFCFLETPLVPDEKIRKKIMAEKTLILFPNLDLFSPPKMELLLEKTLSSLLIFASCLFTQMLIPQ